jgi:hypothetical protein
MSKNEALTFSLYLSLYENLPTYVSPLVIYVLLLFYILLYKITNI